MLLRLDTATPLYPVEPSISRASFEARIMEEPDEIVAVFEPGSCLEGDKLVLQPKRGKPDEVAFTNDEIPYLEDRIVTHNHPNGSPPSEEDVRAAVLANVAELRVVVSGFKVFTMKRPAQGWPSSDKMERISDRALVEALIQRQRKLAKSISVFKVDEFTFDYRR